VHDSLGEWIAPTYLDFLLSAQHQVSHCNMYINATAGRRFPVLLSAEDTVGRLKEVILEEIGVPIRYQELHYNGVVLDHDCATLQSHNIDPKDAEVCLHNLLSSHSFEVLRVFHLDGTHVFTERRVQQVGLYL
jgi:hypothetical protein